MILLKLAAAFSAGFRGHQLRPVLRKDFKDPGWFAVSTYTVGAVLALPFVLSLFEEVNHRRSRTALAASYLLAFLGVGGGVVVGHYLQPDE